jgi:7-cyano-7-deazaguanine synthase
MQEVARLGTRAGVAGQPVRLLAPLMDMCKADIIRQGLALGVDYSLTISCYDPDPDGSACGACDACLLRKRGFADAGLPDVTRYR